MGRGSPAARRTSALEAQPCAAGSAAARYTAEERLLRKRAAAPREDAVSFAAFCGADFAILTFDAGRARGHGAAAPTPFSDSFFRDPDPGTASPLATASSYALRVSWRVSLLKSFVSFSQRLASILAASSAIA